MAANNEYWEGFYKKFGLIAQSSFAELVVGLVPRPNLILDLGCGNGRDSLYFARETQAHILALDSSKVAIQKLKTETKKAAIKSRISAEKYDFESDSVIDLDEGIVPNSLAEQTIVVYARFLVHALTQEGEEGFWRLVDSFLAKDPASLYLALEYRTPRDAELPKQTPTHYRRYAEPAELREKAEKRGLSVFLEEEGTNLSVYGSDNAFLCRQLFKTPDKSSGVS